MIDKYAPIIPYEGMGRIKLYSTIRDLKDLLGSAEVKGVMLNNLWVRYEIDNCMYLFFHLVNGKLFKITTLDEYKGKLFDKISVGMKETDFLEFDNSFVYDEFEEVFESDKGVFIETDVVEHTARWISVFVKELESDDFEEGNW